MNTEQEYTGNSVETNYNLSWEQKFNMAKDAIKIMVLTLTFSVLALTYFAWKSDLVVMTKSEQQAIVDERDSLKKAVFNWKLVYSVDIGRLQRILTNYETQNQQNEEAVNQQTLTEQHNISANGR